MLKDDAAFCAAMLPLVSRTFSLSIEALPISLRDAVRVAYLLCRILDTIEDDTTQQQQRRERLFDAFDFVMTSDGRGGPQLVQLMRAELRGANADLRLCANADAVVRVFCHLPTRQRKIICHSVLEMSEGMRHYSRRRDSLGWAMIASIDDLERYCYYVAGTVGILLTRLFLDDHPEVCAVRHTLLSDAVPFGLALQMVNIVKDVAGDARRGACFLPLRPLQAHTVTSPQGVLAPNVRPQVLEAIRAVCARARVHGLQAARYVFAWPAETAADIRLFAAVPLALAFKTLHLVEHSDESGLCGPKPPKISRDTVAGVMRDAVAAVASDAHLAALLC